MRIRFLSDQIYETGGLGKGPRFAKGLVLDETGVQKALGLADEPTSDWARGFLHRWVQRGVAEEVSGRARPTEAKVEVDGDASAGVAEVGGDEAEVDGSDPEDEGVDLRTLTRAELDALAEERGVDISEARNKGDVIAALEAADDDGA